MGEAEDEKPDKAHEEEPEEEQWKRRIRRPTNAAPDESERNNGRNGLNEVPKRRCADHAYEQKRQNKPAEANTQKAVRSCHVNVTTFLEIEPSRAGNLFPRRYILCA